MRIATFNVENLFDRAKALGSVDWSVGRPALEAHARLSALLEEHEYTKKIKDDGGCVPTGCGSSPWWAT